MKDLSTLCFIQEQTSFAEDYNNQFGYKITGDINNRFFLTFDAILQSFDIMNRNKRMYDADNIMNCIRTDEYIQDQLSRNHWLGEIDHPAADKVGEELTMNRICNPSLIHSSHYIRSPRMVEGTPKLLRAKVQTDSSNKHGMNMAIKIVDGKIIPGFSARLLGELTNRLGKPYVFVKKLITYDWVGYNSHHAALGLINQPIQESVDTLSEWSCTKIVFIKELAMLAANNDRQTSWLCESFGLDIDDVIGLTSSGKSIVLKEGSNVYIQPISDKLIRNATIKSMKDFMN